MTCLCAINYELFTSETEPKCMMEIVKVLFHFNDFIVASTLYAYELFVVFPNLSKQNSDEMWKINIIKFCYQYHYRNNTFCQAREKQYIVFLLTKHENTSLPPLITDGCSSYHSGSYGDRRSCSGVILHVVTWMYHTW
jgi:hypothetical protein